MSRDASIELDFAAELRLFRLPLGEWRKVQEKCDAGLAEIAQRLGPYVLYGAERKAAEEAGVAPMSMLKAVALGRLGTWRLDDVREPILQGLIGGGMPVAEAGKLMRDYFDGKPTLEFVPIAFQVCMAGLIGVEDEEAAGEPQGETGRHRSPGES